MGLIAFFYCRIGANFRFSLNYCRIRDIYTAGQCKKQREVLMFIADRVNNGVSINDDQIIDLKIV